MPNIGLIGNIIVFVLIVLVYIAVRIQRAYGKGKYSQDVQKPRQLKSFFTKMMMIFTVFSGVIAVLGAIGGEFEMAAVFSVMSIIFLVMSYFMRRKFDMTYQETDEYFILKDGQKEYKVFYENIVYWQWGVSEIFLLDGKRSDEEYISIRFDYFNPEILLRTVAEMTFDDRFPRRDFDVYPDDSMKKKEMVHLLKHTDYYYLMEDHL